jgi:hypothetical protein
MYRTYGAYESYRSYESNRSGRFLVGLAPLDPPYVLIPHPLSSR